jgi:aerobic carbon-monoxide dehydrogenase medium subunit
MLEFTYHQPGTIGEAAAMLSEHGEDARVIAGGTAMLIALRQRLVQPRHVISLGRIDSLRGIDWDASRGLRIGALSLHSEVAQSDVVKQHFAVLADLASRMANPQVRNQGTWGGNLCYADPATDPPTALLALDARVVLRSLRGERELAMADFLVDYYATALEPDELLLEVIVPPLAHGTECRYQRFLKTAAEHRPLVNVAVSARRSAGRCESIRIAVGACTPAPVRVNRAEACLTGRQVNADAVLAAAAVVAEDIDALDDSRGSADYRRQMAAVTTRRVLCDLFGVDFKGAA